MTINMKKQLIYVTYDDDIINDIYGDIDDVIDYLKQIKIKILELYPDTVKICLDYDYNYDNQRIIMVRYQRYETDEEFQTRIDLWKKESERNVNREYNEYLRLKEKFEGESK